MNQQGYYQEYVSPQFAPENRLRLVGIVLGFIALVLFVWWFIQVVIGRNFKVKQKTYTDTTTQNGNTGGTTTGGGAWGNVTMNPYLDKLTDDLQAINQKHVWGFMCYGDAERQKLYWDFLGLSEGFQGQILVARKYKTKYGISLLKDLENTKHCLEPELAKRLEATLGGITD